MVTHCGLTVLTHGWGRVLDLKSSPSSSGQSWWPNPKYIAFGDIWNWDHSPDLILFWGELDPYNTLFFQRTLSFFFLSNLWACLHTDALWLWDTLLTHAVHCWCWSHCGMTPLFLRCPIHRKERISFPHQKKIPVSTFCFFHSWHYSYFSQAISLAQTQLLTSWFIHCHYLPKASGDKALWGRGGNGMGQHNFAFDVCYSITEILYLQGFIARVLVAQLPWGVAPAFFLLQHLLQHPWPSLNLGW